MIFRSTRPQNAPEEHQFFKDNTAAELLIHLFDCFVIPLQILQASHPAQGQMCPEWLLRCSYTTQLKYTVHLAL